MSKKKLNTYQVQVEVNVWTDVTIKAETFEEALAQAKELGVKDVVEFEGDFIDGSVDVTGIFK